MNHTLITGASSGIGYELAKLFAREGNGLILVARREEKLHQIAEELQDTHRNEVLIVQQDLSLPQAAEQVYSRIKEKSLRVNTLINNAGFYVSGPFSDTSWEREEDLIRLQCLNHTQLVKLFLPEMLARSEGRILNVCSTGAFMPGPYNAIYCAAKSFALSFSEALAEELKGSGIHVTALCPGGTRTAFQDLSKRKTGFLNPVMRASDVAKAGYRALRKGRRVAVPGWTNKLQVFMLRFLPRTRVAQMAGAWVRHNTNL